MNAAFRRVVVQTPDPVTGHFKPAPFLRCLLDYFGLGESGRVDVELDDCKLRVKPSASNGRDGAASLPRPPNSISVWANGASDVLITHPPFCPVHCITKQESDRVPQDTVDRGIDVGVAVLVESADEKILLTRRADHLRTFPAAWVPPGGHIDEDETIVHAGMRELKEETGLSVGFRDSVLPPWTSCTVLGLWESVFPYELALGLPQRHHVVVYLRCTSPATAEEMDAAIQLDPNEVGACAWLDRGTVAGLAKQEYPPGGHCVKLKKVAPDGTHRHELVENFEEFTRQRVGVGEGGGRLTTGTHYALKLLDDVRLAEMAGDGGK